MNDGQRRAGQTGVERAMANGMGRPHLPCKLLLPQFLANQLGAPRPRIKIGRDSDMVPDTIYPYLGPPTRHDDESLPRQHLVADRRLNGVVIASFQA